MEESYLDRSVIYEGWTEGDCFTFDEGDTVDYAWRWLDDYCSDDDESDGDSAGTNAEEGATLGQA